MDEAPSSAIHAATAIAAAEATHDITDTQTIVPPPPPLPSSAMGSAPLRVGKRVRRRPQRWEGDRPNNNTNNVRPSSSSSRHGVAQAPQMPAHNAYAVYNDARSNYAHHDGNVQQPQPTHLQQHDQREASESTQSVKSVESLCDLPAVSDPVSEMNKVVLSCHEHFTNRREIVDSFHSWQLKNVSKQAAQQKALHIYLKRKLRKRTTKAPEIERAEEDALRNARQLVSFTDEDGGDEEGGGKKRRKLGNAVDAKKKIDGLKAESKLHGNVIVPYKVRLPLDAYLPRRVRPGRDKLTVDDIMTIVPDPPRMTNVLKSQGKGWISLPTVSPSAHWNSRKSKSNHNELPNDMENDDN